MTTLFDAIETHEKPKLREPWPHQVRAIEGIRQAIREGHKRIVLQLPTGAGKTFVSAKIIAGALEKDRRPMFTCPSINLVNQTVQAFQGEGITDIGVIQAQHEMTRHDARVQVASIHTLIRRKLPDVDFVITDEVHQHVDAYDAIIDSPAWKDKIVIGLSATPWKRGMGLRWTKLVIGATMKELIESGVLSRYEVFGPEKEMDLSGVKIVKGEYQEDSLAEAVNKKEITAEAVKMWRQYAEGLNTFLFAVNCAHARSLQKEFQDVGVPWGYIDALTSANDRKALFRAYEKRDLIGIASVGCLVTGVDQTVMALIDCQPTKSEITHVQKLGRALRSAHGKVALILDHAGNCERLGYPDDIHHELLDDRKPHERTGGYEEEPPIDKPRKCKQCYRLIPPRAKKCTACGFIPPIDLDHGVETRDGELKKKTRKEPKPDMVQKQSFYSGLLHIAQQRGYSVGWAFHTYKRRYGVAPAKLNRVREFPSKEVHAFVNKSLKEFREAKSAAPL